MFKFITGFLVLLLPSLALADNTLSFAPPPGDFSMVFLGNLFGHVDGILYGTGSQIMGAMFSVFNSAVLALGGIIIMYTLLVSTLNTAHEGQLLGQKWSSIWVPVRSTLGLALLIPKASGYCLMQIFVMWIVVQGVGAADKVWDAALNYLSRGGVIAQAQIDPLKGLRGDTNQIQTGAQNILAGQVCMLGLQTALENKREEALNNANSGTEGEQHGLCSGKDALETVKDFCNTSVPDFISSVNPVTAYNANPDADLSTFLCPT